MPTQKTTLFSIALDRIETGLAGKDCAFPDGVICEHYEGIGWAGLREARTELDKFTNSHAALVEALERAERFAERMRKIFANPNFTDRYDDAGDCERMRDSFRAALASAKP